MRKTLIALAGLAAAASAQASIIPTLTSGPTPAGGGLYSWVYDATLASDQALFAGDYLTIYDIAGFTSAGATPPNWTVTSALLGVTPPLTLPSDDPAVPNVTFTYTGPTLNYGASPVEIELGPFEILSTANGSTRFDNFASEATKNGGPSRGTKVDTIGTVIVPSGTGTVPEPSVWGLLLAGFGLVGINIRRRHARTSVVSS